jgi:hypothetical protein
MIGPLVSSNSSLGDFPAMSCVKHWLHFNLMMIIVLFVLCQRALFDLQKLYIIVMAVLE